MFGERPPGPRLRVVILASSRCVFQSTVIGTPPKGSPKYETTGRSFTPSAASPAPTGRISDLLFDRDLPSWTESRVGEHTNVFQPHEMLLHTPLERKSL
jgi:hypothetical protein